MQEGSDEKKIARPVVVKDFAPDGAAKEHHEDFQGWNP